MNKKILAVAVSSALAAPMAAQAVKYKLSGQVNRAMVYQNDGQNADIQFVDNGSSGTRWRMKGSEEIGNGMKVGFNWEWQNSQNSNGAAIGSSDFGESQTMRKAEVWFSGGWGKVSLGQGDGAGNGSTEVDLSDTWNVAYVVADTLGGAVAGAVALAQRDLAPAAAEPDFRLTHGLGFAEVGGMDRRTGRVLRVLPFPVEADLHAVADVLAAGQAPAGTGRDVVDELDVGPVTVIIVNGGPVYLTG